MKTDPIVAQGKGLLYAIPHTLLKSVDNKQYALFAFIWSSECQLNVRSLAAFPSATSSKWCDLNNPVTVHRMVFWVKQ